MFEEAIRRFTQTMKEWPDNELKSLHLLFIRLALITRRELQERGILKGDK
jgi:hypothetical protein